MNFIVGALRRPIALLVAILAIVLVSVMAIVKMPIDIFPNLNVPLIYVSQPYGGLTPTQMEGHIASIYETQFLYVTGIKQMESKSIQGASLIKLEFYPGTNMQAAMAEVVASVNRAKASMPQGTVPPTIMRFDAGSVPVGNLVFSSKTRSIGELQDMAQYKIRPMFSSLPGVSSPPPFGGNVRTIVVRVDPKKLRDYNLSPTDVIEAISANNLISPAGSIRIGKLTRLTPVNTLVDNIQELASIPLHPGAGPAVYMRDLGVVEDSSDILAGYALVNGKRSVYIPVTKRSDASTWTVVQEVKAALPMFQDELPSDVKLSYEFDQSGYVANALSELVTEGVLGAVLTGLVVLLFLRCWRSTVIVVTTIPISLLCAVLGLWITGQTINTMTLGGLALAIGILVDEATVAVENIHTHLAEGKFKARAVLDSTKEISLPLLLAMICVLAVFLPSFFMSGVPRALFIPLSIAVGFAMVTAFVLSQTLVPVMSIWLLDHKSHHPEHEEKEAKSGKFSLNALVEKYSGLIRRLSAKPGRLIIGYLILSALILVFVGGHLGTELFPKVESHEFRYRLKAPTGTRVEETERLTLKSLQEIKNEVGANNVDISLAYVGNQPSSFGISTVYLWTSGPQEAVVSVALNKEMPVRMDAFKERLRSRFAKALPNCLVSFEPADLVSQVMSQGAPTPVEIAISGKNLRDDAHFAEKLKSRLTQLPYLRDLQFGQPLDYPTLDVNINRELAGQMGLTVKDLSRSVIAATSSTRFVEPSYWLDKKNGTAYLVQVELPQVSMRSAEDLQMIPAMAGSAGHPLIGDVTRLSLGSTPGEIDRINSKRTLTLTANLHKKDLGTAARDVENIIESMGKPPKGMFVKIRGQLALMLDTLTDLKTGLALAIIAIFLLLAANFQSFRLAFVVTSTLPAVLSGVVIMLALTGSTLNIQSAMGAIMSIGVAVANAILLVTMAETYRKQWSNSRTSALEGARGRIRPILMTSLAMTAGMIPMSLGLGEGGGQTAPLGRAVIGGIIASTVATLIILPLVFTQMMAKVGTDSPSLDPEDPESEHFDQDASTDEKEIVNPMHALDEVRQQLNDMEKQFLKEDSNQSPESLN